jgi:hypothetical protein
MSSLVVIVFLSGCASYRAMPLNSTLSSDSMYFQPHFKDVVIAARAFNKHDCKKYLDRNVIKYGYRPIQLTIENKSEKNYLFSLSRISLPIVRPEEVAEKAHTSTVARAVGYGTAALVFWPFAIPAVVDGVCSAQANEALDKDFAAKTAKDQIIAPHSHASMLIFVPNDEYHPDFNVTLIDLKSNQPREFDVKITR